MTRTAVWRHNLTERLLELWENDRLTMNGTAPR
jgi:hypothetical protein